ncbi:hypothetical protein PHMEG_0004592 [Phytophthora megakarya]|uniref:Uncharacterized protein n=1 Tax=Phytophthora megakarya TaxID=4795 RepID=A0A225WV22_9STRA|nr:hypothetical protein PHMEG_0004592 [Phytophthora megakarya]
MGRRLRTPNELLRPTEVEEAGELPSCQENLLRVMKRRHECAELARMRGQERQAHYYNRRIRNRRGFHAGNVVWMHSQPRGKKATKLVHQWMGPLRIVEPAGFDNFTKQETIIAHVSFRISYHYPEPLLDQVALDIDELIAYEERQSEGNESEAAAPVLTATISLEPATTKRGKKRIRTAIDDNVGHDVTRGLLVEPRRHRRRNRADQYDLEYELSPCSDPNRWKTDEKERWTVDGQVRARWISIKSMSDCTMTNRSWKALGLMKTCKRIRVSTTKGVVEVEALTGDLERGRSVERSLRKISLTEDLAARQSSGSLRIEPWGLAHSNGTRGAHF